ncbi:hypothetical protein HF670_11860 [Acidithiobacillus thiooxidans]|uniref:hypothetical protein n=1 Tax=Acidithiobacillus thiooxidans TaxID=930 RepID=UPI001C06F7A7|nr:hypothetical protein [Acidithiobacillus thiooxidans]MBU2840241.1 hypothetical protein [Acidithiobacillus thiooxidans]
MPTSNVDTKERGAALLITVIVFSAVAALIAAASMELARNNTVTASQVANYNQARTAALVGVAGFADFLNTVQSSPNTATAGSSNCGTNGVCSFVNTLTHLFWGNSGGQVVPPNGGLGAIGYFQGQQVSIRNDSLVNSNPYIHATVSLNIIGNTYKVAVPVTSNSAAEPAQPGIITVISQGNSGQASATAQAVLGPVLPATPSAQNTTLSLAGTSTAGKIVNLAPASQHTYLQAQSVTATTPPQGFFGIIQGSKPTQVTISASALKSQANILFLPPASDQTYPQIEFQNISGNGELSNGREYRLSPKTISNGICTLRFFSGCLQRVPVFSSGTTVSYDSSTKIWTIGNPSSPSPALLIPGAAYFQGSTTLASGLFDNAIISTGNIVDNSTVYAPNYAGPTAVCGSPLQLFPSNFCGPKGTQYIPASIGNIALYADGMTTVGEGASVYGDILSRGNISTNNLHLYGFLIGEGSTNTLSGTTTINNVSAPQSFNPTPLNASQYSAAQVSTAAGINEPIGLLGLTWIN